MLFIVGISCCFAHTQEASKLADPEEPVAAKTESKPFWEWDYLTDDWGGLRSQMSDTGFDFEFVYNGEVMGPVFGGIRRKGEYLSRIDFKLLMDGEKLLKWPGAIFFIDGMNVHGGDPSDNIGDAQVTSNIENFNTWKVIEAWYDQAFWDERISVRLGLYDLNSEFYVANSSLLFLNSSHGIGPDLSQTGENGPSIFATTSTAARLKVLPADNFYFQMVVSDGVPGYVDQPRGTQIIWKKSDGVLLVGEMGYTKAVAENCDAWFSKYSIGAWYYTAKFQDLRAVDSYGNPQWRRTNGGVYLLAEQMVFQEEEKSPQGLTFFMRLGIADGNVNPVEFFVGSGLVYTGLIPGRDDDALGLAMATIFFGNDYQKTVQEAGERIEDVEVNLELTYQLNITPFFAIQPNLQYVINPSGDPAIDNALVLACRVAVSL